MVSRSRDEKQPFPEPRPEMQTQNSASSSFSTVQEDDVFTEKLSPDHLEQLSQGRRCPLACMRLFECAVGPVICVNLVVVCYEADLGTTGAPTPEWIPLANRTFLGIYGLECAVNLHLQRRAFFRNSWSLFDLFIVASGVLGELLTFASEGEFSGSQLGALRTFRVLRLLRVVRLLASCRELWIIVRNLVSTAKTLFWAMLLFGLLLLIWSIMAVEYLHPLFSQVDEEDCGLCPSAFRGVPRSIFTLFQIVSGEDSGYLMNEVIDEHPCVVFFIVPMVFVMVFGLMNLILAVVCDNAAQAKLEDMEAGAKEEGEKMRKALRGLKEMFSQLDYNGKGHLTLEEIQRGIQRNTYFRELLTVLNVKPHEVSRLFEMMDEDGSGTVTAAEFGEKLYFFQAQDTRTTLAFLFNVCEDLGRRAREEDKLMCEVIALEAENVALQNSLSIGPIGVPVESGGVQKWEPAIPVVTELPLEEAEVVSLSPKDPSEVSACDSSSRSRPSHRPERRARPMPSEEEIPRWPQVLPKPRLT